MFLWLFGIITIIYLVNLKHHYDIQSATNKCMEMPEIRTHFRNVLKGESK